MRLIKCHDELDQQLSIATIQVRNNMLNSIPDLTEYNYSCSDEYKQRIYSLIKRVRTRERFRLITKRIATVLLVILLSSGIWLSLDNDARAGFFKWIRESFGINYVYHFYGENQSSLPTYEPRWIPHGLKKQEDNVSSNGRSVLFVNGEKQLLFEYHLIDEGTEIQVIADDVDNPPKKVQINNVMGDLYEDPDLGEASVLVWIDEKNQIALSISSNLNSDQIITIAKKVKKV